MIFLTIFLSYIQFTLSAYQQLIWDGYPNYYERTVLVGDTIEWISQSSELFSLHFDSNLFQNNGLSYSFTNTFYLLGTYSFNINNTATGIVTVTSGEIVHPERGYYELLVGDILRWEWNPENEASPEYPTTFGGSVPGIPVNDYGRYDFQFLIPGYYGWYDVNNNWIIVSVNPGVTIPWSSSASPVYGKVAANDIIRLVWDQPELHLVNISVETVYGQYSYSIGSSSQFGSIFNISTPQYSKSLTVFSGLPGDSNLYAHFDIEVRHILYWTRFSSGTIEVNQSETIRFYAADNLNHNVRVNSGANFDETIFLSESIRSPGTYVDVVIGQPGTYIAKCDYHSAQSVTIIVRSNTPSNHTGGNEDDDDDNYNDDDHNDDDGDNDDDNHNGGGGGGGCNGNVNYNQRSNDLTHAVELSLFMVGLLGLGSYLLDVGKDDQNNGCHNCWHNNNNNNYNNGNNYNNDGNNYNNNGNNYNNNNIASFKNSRVNKNMATMKDQRKSMNNNNAQTMNMNMNKSPKRDNFNGLKSVNRQQHITDFALEQLKNRVGAKK